VPTVEEIAYSAGLFDGEGSAYYGLDRRSMNCYGAISIVQTKRAVLDWIAQKWDFGKVSDSRAATKTGHLFQWRAHGTEAVLFLETVRPYLQVRAERVDGWLFIHSLHTGRGQTGRDSNTGRFLPGYDPAKRSAPLSAVLEFRQKSGRRRSRPEMSTVA